MFTVKQIDICGSETLYATDFVEYHSAGKPTSTDPHEQKPFAEFVSSDGDPVKLYGGTVFVMNASGATVSRWDLGASPVPLRPDVDGRNAQAKASQAA